MHKLIKYLHFNSIQLQFKQCKTNHLNYLKTHHFLQIDIKIFFHLFHLFQEFFASRN